MRTQKNAGMIIGLMIGLSALMLSTACEENKKGFTVGSAGDAEGCTLSLDTLADSEWLFLKALPDKSEVPDISTRLKFESKDGKLAARYNVGSVSDMYDYDCEVVGEELHCKEPPKVKDWCQAFEAGGKTCDAATLRTMEPSLTDEEIAKGMKEAQEVIGKYKGTDKWDHFVLNNNNLGNKLRGILYIKVDKRHCRLRITDNYQTIFNGKKREDSNPAGTNAFVKNDQGELSWEHCTARDLLALESAEFPKKPQNASHQARWAPGKEAHQWLLSEAHRVPKDGCTYDYDVYVSGRPTLKGQTPETVDVRRGKELRWHFAHTFADASTTAQGEITQMVVRTQCEGKETDTIVACNAVLVR